MRHNGKHDEEIFISAKGKNTVMGTAASAVAAKPSPYCLSYENARRGNPEESLLVLQQGMDPNERESPSSG